MMSIPPTKIHLLRAKLMSLAVYALLSGMIAPSACPSRAAAAIPSRHSRAYHRGATGSEHAASAADLTVFRAVVSAEVLQMRRFDPTFSGKFILGDRTSIYGYPDPGWSIAYWQKNHPGHMSRSLLHDLRRRMQREAQIPPGVDVQHVQLVSASTLNRTFRHGRWNAFHARYPKASGVISFSLPGYSRDGKSAAVIFSHYWGPQQGYGYLMLLQKEGGEWRIKEKPWGWQI